MEYFIEKGWCKRIDDEEKQYVHLLRTFDHTFQLKTDILDHFFENDPEFLQFMVLHSVFSIKPKNDYDWFEQYMIEKLQLSDEVIDKLLHPDLPPQEIMDILAPLSPEPVGFDAHPIRIEYGMWQRITKKMDEDEVDVEDFIEGAKSDKKKKPVVIILHPIHITYLDWEREVVTQKDISMAIAEYENIECDPDTSAPMLDDEQIWEDVPF